MQPLTPTAIARARSDKALQARLGQELTRLIGPGPASTGLSRFVARLRSLPPGLRAMAATYELDVSMALDDLAQHFVNWHHLALSRETFSGLRVLGAHDEAEVFHEALLMVLPYWKDLRSGAPARGTPLYTQLRPLNFRLWNLLGYQGDSGRSLLALWAPYARAHPGSVCART